VVVGVREGKVEISRHSIDGDEAADRAALAQVLAQLGNQTVVCSGVVIGTPRGFDLMCRLMVKQRCPFDKMADQGALNYLAYSGKLASLDVRFERRGAGVVNTVGVFKGQPKGSVFEAQHMRGGYVLNDDGAVSPCVHQYDRLTRSFGPNATFGRTESELYVKALADGKANALA